MGRVTPAQTNFNAGEISKRLHARFDLNLYDIAMAEMAGWVPLPEGGMDACPGFIHVEQAKGPCRLIPFDYNATQGYLIEMSAGSARLYTNDARIEDGDGNPIEVALPYDKPAIDALSYEQSFDVLYLFHKGYQTREFTRTGADTFEVNLLALENGPFEPRNKDKSLTVFASGVTGAVMLQSSSPIFAAGDVGGLFQLEADDFGDISSWEPGITVTLGQLLTWNERVYRVIGGSGRTGTVAPIHNEGVEWDGIGAGKDLNEKNAGGVQLEYMHDRLGVLRITAFVDASNVDATVLRQLPFTASSSDTYHGGYYDGWGDYVPPDDSVSYVVGTWRWRFGAFSDRRGWPSHGVVWDERLVLAKGSTLYGSVAGDLNDHSKYNELGDISTDMAFVVTISNPNPIIGLVADKDLLILNATGMFALGASNQAQGVGPGNLKTTRQNNEGGAPIQPVQLDGRTIYIGKSVRRVIEGGFEVQQDRQQAIDLTRYARHIGTPRFTALASQKDPNRLVWACRADGTLAVAAYVPEEQVLGWARRPLATGMAARSIATITDPAGELNQLWLAAEFGGAWQVLRLAQFRQEEDANDPPMTDMAVQYEGAAASTFGPAPWLANKTVQVNADDIGYGAVVVDGAGMFTLPQPASRVNWGLTFPARVTTLRNSKGSDNGPALGKMQRVSRLAIDVLKARGLRVTVQGARPRDLEQLQTDSPSDTAFAPVTGVVVADDVGTNDRMGQITIERMAPYGATIRAIMPTVEPNR